MRRGATARFRPEGFATLDAVAERCAGVDGAACGVADRGLGGAGSTGAAVANETSRFVVPLGEQKIDRVLERTGDSMIVLGRDENVGIETLDLGGPRFGMGLTVLPHYRWHRFVEKRQVKIFDVHELELGVAALLCDFVNPFSHGLAVATRPRASNDNGNLEHKFFSGGF